MTTINYYGSYYSPKGERTKKRGGIIPSGGIIQDGGVFITLPNGGVICGLDRNGNVYVPSIAEDASDIRDGYTDGLCVVPNEDYPSVVESRKIFREMEKKRNEEDRLLRETPEYKIISENRAAERRAEMLETSQYTPDREDGVQGWGFAD